MSSSMKDARWMRAIDTAAAEGLDFHELDYSTERVPRLEAAQQWLDDNPSQVEPLAKRFNTLEPQSLPWVEETHTSFAIRAAKADGVRQALLYARVKVGQEASAEDLANSIDEYLADLERPIHTPSRIHQASL